MKNKHFIKDLFRVMSLMEKKAVSYSILMICNCANEALFGILVAVVIKYLLDATVGRDTVLLNKAIILFIASVLGTCVATPIFGYFCSKSIAGVMMNIKLKVFRHIEHVNLKYFEDNHSGEIMSRFLNDMPTIEDIYSNHIKWLLSTLLSGLGALAVMVVLDWRFAAMLAALGFLSVFAGIRFAGPIRGVNEKIQQKQAVLTERLVDLLAGFNVIKLFHLKDTVTPKYVETSGEVAKLTVKSAKWSGVLGSTNTLITSLNFSGVILIGSFLSFHGYISFGSLLAIIQLSSKVKAMFRDVGDIVSGLSGSFAGAMRCMEVFDVEKECEKTDTGKKQAENLNSKDDSMINIANAAFSYDGNNAVLKGLSIKVGKGKVAAIVGPSGGGKSTVVKLLLKFYSLQGGNIFIDKKPIEKYTLEELRNMIAYVPQDAYLFNATIKENIKYGRPDATDDEIIAAAKAANAHGFITEQPEGYDTMAGERGVKLSGGQKQRIGIARAILKNAPILLLDEATSALDSDSEQVVQDALNGLMKGRTTIAIAHRLSTIEHADVIYVVDEGRVVEQGKHKELSAGGGLYRRLYELQFQKEEAAG